MTFRLRNLPTQKTHWGRTKSPKMQGLETITDIGDIWNMNRIGADTPTGETSGKLFWRLVLCLPPPPGPSPWCSLAGPSYLLAGTS